MSGRKSTEVSALLKRGELARKASEGNYQNCITNGATLVKKNQTEAKAILDYIRKTDMGFSEECKKEFSKEVGEIQHQYDLLKNKEADDYGNKITDIKNRFSNVEKQILAADDESEAIRRSIQGKSHYCTPEYNRADAVLKEYNNCAAEKERLVSEMNAVVRKSSQKKREFESARESVERLHNRRNELEDKAKKICELREKSSKAKKYLEDQFKEIEEQIASKFMPKEYKDVESMVKNLMKLSEQQILDEFDANSEKLGLFKTKLDKKYATYLEDKAKTEAILENCEQMLDNNVFYDAADYYNEGPNAKEYRLVEYIQKYAQDTSYVNKINSLLKDAKDMLEGEKFEEAQEQLNKASAVIEKAVAYGVLVQKNMIETTYTAADIRDVMIDFHYYVSLEMLSDSPKDGWRIIAKSGDERISFDKIYVGEDDEVQIDIDHQITQGGSCGVAWKRIVSKLEEKGINIKKITMENGTAVTDKTAEMKSNSKKNIEKTRTRK